MIWKRQNIKDCPGIHGENEITLSGGTYDNGKEFIVILGGKQHDRLWLYTFDGHNWVIDTIINCTVFNAMESKNIITFNNGILYTRNNANNDALLLFWQNGRWNLNNIAVEHMGNEVEDIQLGDNFLIVQGGRIFRERIWVYRKYGDEWIHDKELFDKSVFYNNTTHLNVSAGNNFFVVTKDNSKEACVYRWNGNNGFAKNYLTLFQKNIGGSLRVIIIS